MIRVAKRRKIGRPYAVTTQEMSVTIWIVGFVIFFITIINDPVFPLFYLILFFISSMISAAGMIMPNYMITKYNLNMMIDRMTNPNYENWIRVTKNKKLFLKIVETGPLGQSKGMVSGYNADIINKGNYTVTLPNGNHAIIAPDVMSNNADLEEEIGWKLVKRKYFILGYNAYRKALREQMVESMEDEVMIPKKTVRRIKLRLKKERSE
jgi:hypothetical protein